MGGARLAKALRSGWSRPALFRVHRWLAGDGLTRGDRRPDAVLGRRHRMPAKVVPCSPRAMKSISGHVKTRQGDGAARPGLDTGGTR